MKKKLIIFVLLVIVFSNSCVVDAGKVNEVAAPEVVEVTILPDAPNFIELELVEATAQTFTTSLPTSTPTVEPTLEPTPTAEPTPSPTIKVTPTVTPSPTLKPTPAPTPTVTQVVKVTPTPIVVSAPTVTVIPIIRPVITSAPTPTCTPSPTPKATEKITVTPIPSKDSWLNSYCSMEDLRTKALSQDIYSAISSAILVESIKTCEGMNITLQRDTAKQIYAKFTESHYAFQRLQMWLTQGYEVRIIRLSSKHYYKFMDFRAWVDDVVVNELRISTLTTKQTAVQEINKYICEHFHYDSSALNEEAYLNYTSGRLVCKDYAVIFQEMCLRCGIECYVEQDWTNYKDGHAYNYLLTDTGKKYYCDVTFNDSQSKSQGKITKHLFNETRIIY